MSRGSGAVLRRGLSPSPPVALPLCTALGSAGLNHWPEQAGSGIARTPSSSEQTVHDSMLKAFDNPDEVREFPHGRIEIVHVGGTTLGRATYQPGWKWSLHNAPIVGTSLCHVPHTGVVLAGHAVAAFEDGSTIDLLPGKAFYIPSTPHDSWVIGNEPYVSLHVLSVPSK